jgi:hypothetical protein
VVVWGQRVPLDLDVRSAFATRPAFTQGVFVAVRVKEARFSPCKTAAQRRYELDDYALAAASQSHRALPSVTTDRRHNLRVRRLALVANPPPSQLSQEVICRRQLVRDTVIDLLTS